MANLRTPDGDIVYVEDDKVAGAIAQGLKPVSDDESSQDLIDQAMEARKHERGVVGGINAGLTNVLSGATAGISDAVLGSLLSKGEKARMVGEREAHPIISGVSNLAGAVGGAALAPLSPAGLAAKAGSEVSALGEGAGLAKQVLASTAGGATEGALLGAGQGVSELGLSDDPLTAERIASVLSSNALLGGAVGGAIGGAGRLAEKGLARAKVALDEHVANSVAAADVPEDLASLDAKGLREAKQTELDSIEASRVPERKQVADDLATFREDLKDQKLWLATKGAEDSEIRVIGKQTLKADKQLDNLLDNPKALAERPQTAITALQKQEHALEQLIEADPKIRANVEAERAAGETAPVETGTPGEPTSSMPEPAKVEPSARLAALDQVPAALERNRQLQNRIRQLIAEPKSERLGAIADAADRLQSQATRKPSLLETMLGGSIFGATAGAVAHIPFIGQLPGAAHIAGAKVSDAITKLVFGRLGNATAEAAKRTSSAIGSFLDVGAKLSPIARAAPILASKTLANVRYAPSTEAEPEHAKAPKLVDSFLARSAEISSQVAPDETGVLRVRPEARQQIASRIQPISVHAPKLGDQLETLAVRRLEFLASKLPKRPDLPVPPGGKDMWRPSDLEMRTFARYVAAVEDPHGVEERLATASITPEDAEAYHAIYPERAADLQFQIASNMGQLRKTLPYKKRLAYSIFSGVPVDPAMDPRVLNVLQASFASEAHSDGGMSAPTAQPQFGSVKKSVPAPTPSQTRSG